MTPSVKMGAGSRSAPSESIGLAGVDQNSIRIFSMDWPEQQRGLPGQSSPGRWGRTASPARRRLEHPSPASSKNTIRKESWLAAVTGCQHGRNQTKNRNARCSSLSGCRPHHPLAFHLKKKRNAYSLCAPSPRMHHMGLMSMHLLVLVGPGDAIRSPSWSCSQWPLDAFLAISPEMGVGQTRKMVLQTHLLRRPRSGWSTPLRAASPSGRKHSSHARQCWRLPFLGV